MESLNIMFETPNTVLKCTDPGLNKQNEVMQLMDLSNIGSIVAKIGVRMNYFIG